MQILVSENIVPIAQFKAQAAHWLQHVAETGQPLVITVNGKPAGVLLSPREFDRLQERQRFLESLGAGLADADAGRVMNSAELKRRLAERRTSSRAK